MSWRKVKLGDILTESKVESEEYDPDRRITVRLNFKGVEKRPFEKGVEGGTKYYVRKAGQFIYGKQNLFKGAFGLVPQELDGFESSQDIPAFDIDKKCLPEWLIYFLRQGNFYQSLESIATGTGSRRIQPSRLFEVEIPLPSLNDQQEVIKKIQEIEGRYTLLDVELDKQQAYLRMLYQTILKEAVEGKLTKQDPTDEPATELLKRIIADKKVQIKAGKLKKEKGLPPISEDELPFELPRGWVWVRFGEICHNVDYGTSEKATEMGEIPILRMGNVHEGKVVLTNLKYVKRGIKDLPRLFLKNGDLIFNRTNSYELVGKCGIYEGIDNIYTLASYLIRVSVPKQFILTEYVNFYINSNICRLTQIEPQITQQTGQANFSGSKLKSILFPLPPFLEQQRIVSKAQQLQKQLSQLEAQVQQSRRYAQQLFQSVLREAFSQNSKSYKKEYKELSTIAVKDTI